MGALEHALPNGPPDTVAGWRAAADALLSPPCCTFHRNMEISSRYAWLYAQQPTCFKWAGMAAIASHHARLVLFPFRLDADRSGYVDLPRSLSRRRLLTEDANRMREVNNAIYDDTVWVHLAYLASADGVEDLRRLLRPPRVRRAALRLRDDRPGPRGPGGRGVAGGGPTGGRRHGLGRQPRSPRARTAHRGATALRPSVGQLRPAGIDGLDDDLRGARPSAGGQVLHVVLRLLAGRRARCRAEDPYGPEDHAVRRPLAMARDQCRPRFRRLDADQDLLDRTLGRVVEEAKRYADRPCVVPT